MASATYDDGATSVLLCGVGGQGTILAAEVLAKTAMACGDEVKLSEIHGMAQRGGAVTTDVRFGERVSSMVCCAGSSDVVLAFETTEALRNLPFLREGGTLLVNDQTIKPLPVLTGRQTMPDDPQGALQKKGAVLVQAERLAEKAGSRKCANIVLLGALSASLAFPVPDWEEQVRACVPKGTEDMNVRAFELGRAAAKGVDDGE